ncbi:hypothetical protein H8S20_11305 [Clostridium sp. NSJ-6]|uniref:DGQHR domain-containing protein n=1 Tax=Clostridium hominis TaxID=2763036 RepID=A0ABR7DDK1_9CLOT|nr:hypothetical protein [Clostridium hominis]MBC5629476.1 hypothetical protein [Clostridium hominis]
MSKHKIKKDVQELNILLSKIIDNEVDNFKLQKEINKSFCEKGLNPKFVKYLFSGTKVVSDMRDIEKMTFADACYKSLNDDKFNIYRYYSDNKITEWANYVNPSEKINEIYCEDFRRINLHEYHGDFTYEQVYKYMKNKLWLYPHSTQRSAECSEIADNSIIREININNKAVNEISEIILNGKFEPTEIIINCMLFKGKTPQVTFEKRYKEIGDLIIKPNYDLNSENYTICTILDGYHRILGIGKAVELHYEKTGEWLSGKIACKLVLADIVRAKRIVELVFKRTDDDKTWLKILEQSDYTEFVDMIVSNSYILKGNVADTYEQCKYNKKITYKVILTDTIKKLKIDVANKSSTLFTTIDMTKIIDTLFNLIEETNKKNTLFDEVYKLPNMFIGYFTIAYILKDKDLQLNDYLKILSNMRKKIDMSTIMDLKLSVKQCPINKVIAYFENIVSEVI